MKPLDLLAFVATSLRAQRLRSILIVVAMAIGVAGVVLLVWLGEAARRYVVTRFEALGTNLVIVLPGRNETTGALPPLFGETARDLTTADAEAMLRSPAVKRVAPVVVGSAFASVGNRSRETTVLGATAALQPVRQLALGLGTFLADGVAGADRCVLGATLKHELFGESNPLGEFVRVGDRRFRVCGVLAPAGVSLGNDLDEMVVLSVAAAQALFDQPALFRVLVEATGKESLPRAVGDVARIVAERHDGERDVTVITQDAMVATFDGILRALTLAVAGIAAISLLVAGILVMNVMVVAVAQRRGEVGVLKALGAPRRTIRQVFLGEAVMLSLVGSGVGLLVGEFGSRLIGGFVPALTPGIPAWATVVALAVAIGSGLAFGTAPALRAARLDAVQALARR